MQSVIRCICQAERQHSIAVHLSKEEHIGVDNPQCQLAVDNPYYIKVWIIHIKLLLSAYLDYPLEYLMHGASSQIGSSTIKYLVRYINETTLVIPKRYLNSGSLACVTHIMHVHVLACPCKCDCPTHAHLEQMGSCLFCAVRIMEAIVQAWPSFPNIFVLLALCASTHTVVRRDARKLQACIRQQEYKSTYEINGQQ